VLLSAGGCGPVDRVREFCREPGGCAGSLDYRGADQPDGFLRAPGFMLAAILLLGGIFCYWFIVGDLDSES
jgi:hypothetical protein